MELKISKPSEERVIRDIESSLTYTIRLYRYWLSQGKPKEEAMKRAVEYVVHLMRSSTPVLFLAPDEVVELLLELKSACSEFLEMLQKVKFERRTEAEGETGEKFVGGLYSKYLVPIYTVKSDYPPGAQRGILDLGPIFGEGVDIGFRYTYIHGEPFTFEAPHSHDYDQLLIFLGPSENIQDFDAEIEIALGEKGERYPITSNTLVYVPKGLIHTPFYFKRLGKPVMFINMFFGSAYHRKVFTPP
ncbi:MAG: hypothetical protein RMJ15_05155 [Nitrososphaerota archaeon]|nr:hypothetical protein [Candidatus Bathyarchaeota archaeon]MDW8023106.1 hypothetical protein [Nitrososphaerota archaeon]